MKLFIQKVYPDAIIPTKNFPSDAGYDLYAYLPDGEVTLYPGERKLIDTGIKVCCERIAPGAFVGVQLEIRPRSGNALKLGLSVINTPGTVDENYRNNIGVILINLSNTPQIISNNMRIAQMVPMPVYLPMIEEVESLDETDRGLKGFGSSGV